MTNSNAGSLGAWAEAKMVRATTHFEDLRERVDAWFASDPYRLEPVIAGDRHSWRLYLRVDCPPPLIEWSTILGDCLHNLRSALDAAVWELAHADGARPTYPKQVQFPFCESPAEWQRRLDRQLVGLHVNLLERLEAVQPYNHSEGGERLSALSLLNALDVDDKHKGGITAEIRATQASNRSQVKFETEEAAERHVRPVQGIVLELKDGALLHEEAASDPIEKVRGEFDATIVFTIMTPRGPATIWKALDLAFNAVIITLNRLYAVT